MLLAPPGVDTQTFTPRSAGWRKDGYLLSVCRLHDTRKGLDRLIEAYATLLAGDSGAPDLVLAGRGQIPHALSREIGVRGLSTRVQVRRNIPQSELPDLYREASVYIQTSYEEGLGISVLEAMSSGLPVVSTMTAGSLETVAHGLTGWLIDQDDRNIGVVTAVARRTLQTLHGSGPKMARHARERATALFSTEAALSRYMATYTRALAAVESSAPVERMEPCTSRLRPPTGPPSHCNIQRRRIR